MLYLNFKFLLINLILYFLKRSQDSSRVAQWIILNYFLQFQKFQFFWWKMINTNIKELVLKRNINFLANVLFISSEIKVSPNIASIQTWFTSNKQTLTLYPTFIAKQSRASFWHLDCGRGGPEIESRNDGKLNVTRIDGCFMFNK